MLAFDRAHAAAVARHKNTGEDAHHVWDQEISMLPVPRHMLNASVDLLFDVVLDILSGRPIWASQGDKTKRPLSIIKDERVLCNIMEGLVMESSAEDCQQQPFTRSKPSMPDERIVSVLQEERHDFLGLAIIFFVRFRFEMEATERIVDSFRSFGVVAELDSVAAQWQDNATVQESPKVKRAEYSSDDPMDLANFLITANIRLVRAEFLWNLCKAKGSIPRRQEAEDDYFETAEGKQSALVRHEEVKSWASGHREALICSISHCWEAREHSDPCGHQLQIICDCTRLYAAAYDAPVWLFFDQISLFQFKRSEEQDRSFRLAMGHMHLLYCHEHTLTLRVQSISSDEVWEQGVKEGRVVKIYDEKTGEVRSVPLTELTRNQNPYLERGWCQAEFEWSSTRAQSTRNQRIDVSGESQILQGKVPMTPEVFRKQVQKLKFTHRSDLDPVYHLQEKVFMEKVTNCKHLKLEFLDVQATQTLVESLPYYACLETCALLNFECSNDILEALLASFQHLLRNNTLRELKLTFRGDQEQQVDMILTAVADTLPENFSLTSFHIDAGTPGEEAAKTFAEAMRKNTTLMDVELMGPWCMYQLGDPPQPVLEDAVWAVRKFEMRNAGQQDHSVQSGEETAGRRPIWPPVKVVSLAKLLQQNSAVTNIDLWDGDKDDYIGPARDPELGDAGAQALAEALKENKTVKRFDFFDHRIGYAGAQALAGALMENKTLREIQLACNQIGDAGAQAFAEALKENKSVTEVSLRSNQIGDAGAWALAQAIKENKTVTEIDLSSSQIGDAGARALAEALKENKAVRMIKLSSSRIGEVGAQALAQALKENKTVTEIDLAFTQIGDAGARALAEALKENKTVKRINLFRSQIGYAGAQALAGALMENKTLREIQLGCNQIGDAGAQALAEALKENKTVTKIDFYQNQIGDAGAQALAEALKENKSVTEVSLRSNQIGDAGAWALAEALKENKTVTAIDLSSSQIGDAGARALAEALKENKAVSMINKLSSSRIGEVGAQALAQALKENKTVTDDGPVAHALAEALEENKQVTIVLPVMQTSS
ncbi:NLRC3 [Symbiodinium microadriaticum]|nr:NLRC3 [Symbiodinium microadriaticum]CAE7942057.1 NLRC3 [Symbiodinium sp. KB8]